MLPPDVPRDSKLRKESRRHSVPGRPFQLFSLLADGSLDHGRLSFELGPEDILYLVNILLPPLGPPFLVLELQHEPEPSRRNLLLDIFLDSKSDFVFSGFLEIPFSGFVVGPFNNVWFGKNNLIELNHDGLLMLYYTIPSKLQSIL